ncbi:hypothetical protein [Streptomyces sedi]|uniref:Uncharacterized protein n=1 Tax=Streptomyces sedi TaxID=555059 RepID=A0A5C4UTR2_9ACTN|nr:hypothetical protein [Streptomyces sedi]TNM26673.1 hypothetical protein FH715_23255 [Streptomyces sedi]
MANTAPTDPEGERAKGRVPLWLDPDDARWLSQHCGCPADAPQEERERCDRIRFRAAAALHKHGHPH